MLYRKITPSLPLQPFVECYYVWENELLLPEPLLVESPPNGYVAMVFIYGDRYRVGNSQQPQETVPQSFLAGQFTRKYTLHLQGKVGMVGIVFKPAAVASIFRISMVELTDQRHALDAVLGAEARDLNDQILEAPDHSARVSLIESFLLAKICASPFKIDVVDHAVDIILDKKGSLSVKDLADELHLCRRHFERRFVAKVGLPPKYYARIKRLSYVCSLLANGKPFTWHDIIYEGGFYDQSHFIKDFTEFIGKPPTEYVLENRELSRFLDR